KRALPKPGDDQRRLAIPRRLADAADRSDRGLTCFHHALPQPKSLLIVRAVGPTDDNRIRPRFRLRNPKVLREEDRPDHDPCANDIVARRRLRAITEPSDASAHFLIAGGAVLCPERFPGERNRQPRGMTENAVAADRITRALQTK